MKTSRKINVWVTGAAAAVALTAVGVSTIRAQTDQGQGMPPPQAGPRRPGPGGDSGLRGPFGGGPFGDGPLIPRVPDVTDAQRQQMRAIVDRHQAEIRPVMEQLHTARTALEDAIVSTPGDEATIRLKSADVAAAEADLAVIRARVYAEVAALLTPEQQQQLQEQRNRMKERLQNGPRRPQAQR